MVYSERWPKVFDGMAPEGWADESWFRLIEGGTNFLLDSVPGGVEVVLRSIDLMAEARNKALVWQTGFVKYIEALRGKEGEEQTIGNAEVVGDNPH